MTPGGRSLPWRGLLLSFALVGWGLLLCPLDVDARAGGGHGYSGGGDGGGGGGGGEGGLLLARLLLWLIIEHPLIGIPLTIAVLVLLARSASEQRSLSDWTSSGTAGSGSTAPLRRDLGAIAQVDPDFSAALFEDFIEQLYARAHLARHDLAALASLSAYLSGEARGQLARRLPRAARAVQVVIGTATPTSVQVPTASDGAAAPPPPGRAVPPPLPGAQPPVQGPARVVVQVTFDANIACVVADSEQNEHVVERWTFVRDRGARTRPPAGARTFACPNCGAPESELAEGRCRFCGQVVADGRFDWVVTDIVVLRRTPRPSLLTGVVAETGTESPTRLQPGLQAALGQLEQDDPGATTAALDQRVRRIHADVGLAWTARDLAGARRWLSDALHARLAGQLEEYRRQGLVNTVEQPRVTRCVPVAVVRDRWYDAVTFRVWATGRDVTRVAATGKVVGGDPKRERPYSEYWTLLRRSSVRGAPRDPGTCPACGAPLELEMSGSCPHCSSHVTSGEFDWVLSRIQQD